MGESEGSCSAFVCLIAAGAVRVLNWLTDERSHGIGGEKNDSLRVYAPVYAHDNFRTVRATALCLNVCRFIITSPAAIQI